MSEFGVIQKNDLFQYTQGQISSRSDKVYQPEQLRPHLNSISHNNMYPFSAFGLVEVLNQQSTNRSPQKKQIAKQNQNQSDFDHDSFNHKKLKQSNLLTGVLIGPNHLLVQLDNSEIACKDLRVTFGQLGQVSVTHIYRSNYLALNRFSILLLDTPAGVQRGYLGMLTGKRTFDTRYFYTLDTINDRQHASQKDGVIISGYSQNQLQSLQVIYNQVSDIMGGVLINVCIDKSNMSKEQKSFARNHWPILVNDSQVGFCVVGFTQELNSKGIKGILINSEQFNQIVLFTQNYQPQDILRIPCCAQLSQGEYEVDVKSIKAHKKKMLNATRINYRLIATTDNEQKLIIWQVDNKKLYSETKLSSNSFCLVAEGKNLYICLQDKIQIWDWQLNQTVSNIQCPYPINHLVKINSKYMVSADLGGQIIVWKKDKIKSIIMKPNPKIDCTEVTSMVSFNEKFIIAGFKNGKIRIFDISNNELVKEIDNGHYKRNKQNSVNALLVFNQEYLISGSSDSSVIVWSLCSEYRILKKLNYENQVQSISALNEKEMIVAHGNYISVYNLSTDQTYNLTDYYDPHDNQIIFCTTVDHEQFTTADAGGTIKFWKIDKVQEEIYESISHEELQKISDQLSQPSNYNYFFFRNFVQFQQNIPAAQQRQPSKDRQSKYEYEQNTQSQLKYTQDIISASASSSFLKKQNDSLPKSYNNNNPRPSKYIDLMNLQNNKLQQQAELFQQKLNSGNEVKLTKELEELKIKYQELQDQQIKQNKSPQKNRNENYISLEQHQKEIENLQKQIHSLSQTASNLESDNNNLKNKIYTQEEQIQQFRINENNNHNSNINYDQIQNQTDQLQKQLEKLNQHLNILESENNRLKKQLNNNQQPTNKTLEKKNVESQNNEKLQKEITQLKKQLDQLNRQLNNSENENNRLNQHINTLEQENSQYNQYLNDISKIQNSQQNTIDPLQEEIARLRQEFQIQLQQFELLNQQNEGLRLDIIDKDNQIEELRNSIQELKDSYNEIQNLQQEKYKLDLDQKEKEKEDILQILNDQKSQNQNLMKTLELTRDQHIRNLQETNKERRQILENLNSQAVNTQSLNINPSRIGQNHSHIIERRNSTNQNDNYDKSKDNLQKSVDIQNFKQEISMMQTQISSLKKSLQNKIGTQSNNQSNLSAQNIRSQSKHEQTDKFNENQNKTAQKGQMQYLDPHSKTPIQNRRAPSANSIYTFENNNQPKNKDEQIQNILQTRLYDIQDQIGKISSHQSKQQPLMQNLRDNRLDSSVNYSSPVKHYQTSYPTQQNQTLNTQGSTNSSIIITGKGLGSRIQSPLKLNKCNIEIDISAVEEDEQFSQNYCSPQKQFTQTCTPQVTVQFEQNRQKVQKNYV